MQQTNQAILQKFKDIRTWKRGDIRAPHKPLLLLLAISRLLNGEEEIPYESIHETMKNLLNDFGRPTRDPRPYFPFVRLASDGIWRFNKPELIEHNTDYSKRFLQNNGISAGFIPEIAQALKTDRNLVREIIYYLLENNFPETYHESILKSVGLEDFLNNYPRIRDPHFRNKILDAYSRRCAICNYNIRIRDTLVGLEAAHIKWHQAGGPSYENNGLALCSLHHLLLDYGALTLDETLRIRVSDKVNGNGMKEWLLRFEDKPIILPRKKQYYPQPEFIQWHANEVFKTYGNG